MKRKTNLRDNKGITLIALVITIIILIILAGVSVNLIFGQNGLINRVNVSSNKYNKEQAKEKLELELAALLVDKEMVKEYNVEEYITNRLEAKGFEVNEDIITVNEWQFLIDRNILKIVEELGKAKGEKPQINLTTTSDEILEEVTIKVEVTTTEGTIIAVIKPDKTTTTEVNFEYKVTENKTYTFIAEGSNGRKSVASIQITNVKETAEVPIIESNYGYPIITEYGVKLDGIKITYDTKEGLENYYSIDNGTTWNKYTGPFQILGTGTVMAKSMKNGNILSEASQKVTMPTDALPLEAYDGKDDTYVKPNNDITYYINIDPTMKNKKIKVYMQSNAQTYCIGRLYIVLENGTEEIKATVNLESTFNSTIEIPENAVKIKITLQKSTRIYEIRVDNDPKINLYEYPILTQDGVILKNNKVTINYYWTNVTKLYSLDNMNWETYNGEEIELAEGQTIYAKGIDQYGNETRISSYTLSFKKDIIGSLAYDGEEDSYFKADGSYYMDIDSSMLGKSVRINMKSTAIEYGWGYIYVILDDGTNEEKILVKNKSSFNSTIDIPENAKRILFKTQKNVVLYEMEPIK